MRLCLQKNISPTYTKMNRVLEGCNHFSGPVGRKQAAEHTLTQQLNIESCRFFHLLTRQSGQPVNSSWIIGHNFSFIGHRLIAYTDLTFCRLFSSSDWSTYRPHRWLLTLQQPAATSFLPGNLAADEPRAQQDAHDCTHTTNDIQPHYDYTTTTWREHKRPDDCPNVPTVVCSRSTEQSAVIALCLGFWQ